MKRKPRRRSSTISPMTRRRRAAAASGRRCARPSRTSSASGSRARSAPSPTCSGPPAADPSAPARTGRRRRGRLVDAAASAPRTAVGEHLRPDDVAVAFDDGVRAAEVDAPPPGTASRGCRRRPPSPRALASVPDFVAAQRVAGVNADADDVAWLDVSRASDSSVSSTMRGVPHAAGVAPASTNSQRGVMTPTPKER